MSDGHRFDRSRRILIYGANGYTGRLLVEAATTSGIRPIVAGRSAAAVEALASAAGCEPRVFALDPFPDVNQLRDVDVVVNAAGPFGQTAPSLFRLCCAARASYLDVCGEVEVLDALLGQHTLAADAGITVVPGIGYAHSDALLAATAAVLASPVSATIALRGFDRYSPGTLRTVFEDVAAGGRTYRDGRLQPARELATRRSVPFGSGLVRCASVTWGDLALVGRSTGVRHAQSFAAVPRPLAAISPFVPLASRLARTQSVRRLGDRLARRSLGPTPEQRETEGVEYWAEVVDDAGRRASATMVTGNLYNVTVEAILAAVKALDAVVPGAYTPSRAFGVELGLSLPSVTHQPPRICE